MYSCRVGSEYLLPALPGDNPKGPRDGVKGREPEPPLYASDADGVASPGELAQPG